MDFNATIYNSMARLCRQSDRLLLCVSGGIDSIVMLDVLHKGNWNISVAHCNFSLRGDESDGDENFVRDTCQKYGIKFHIIKFDTNSYAREHKVNTQIAARELRYNYFFELKKEFGYDKIVVAHHLDDSIETFFINLFRGTGIKGLSGINDSRNGIIRPMLEVTRAQISDYAISNGLSHREDSSNSHDHYLRNKIRHHIIPAIVSISENFRETMFGNLSRLYDAEKFIETQIDDIKNRICSSDGKTINISSIKNNANFGFIIFRILHPYGFSSEVIAQLEKSIQSSETSKWYYGERKRILLEKDLISIIDMDTDNNTININPNRIDDSKAIIIEEDSILIETIHINQIENYKHTPKSVALVDKSKVNFPITIRRWKAGDRIQPLGMRGSKTIGDFLTDRKISIADRSNIMVVEDYSKKIIWIAGLQLDDYFKITSDTTYVIKLDIEKIF